jgi:hypothetical protein
MSEVRSIPLELLDRIIEGPTEDDPTGYLAIKELRDLLAKPVYKQKARPVAYRFTRPGHRVFLEQYNSPKCYFRDPENWLCEPLYLGPALAAEDFPKAREVPQYVSAKHGFDHGREIGKAEGWNEYLAELALRAGAKA